jgi:hypothetical protein
MRKYLILAALAFVAVAPATARAGNFFHCNNGQCDQYGFAKSWKPRAGPWYLYWPYPAYFTYPAPTGAIPPNPEYMSTGGFAPNMYQMQQFAPYPTNGFGQ